MKLSKVTCKNCGSSLEVGTMSHIKNQQIKCSHCGTVYFSGAKHSKIGAILEADFEREDYREKKKATAAEWEFRNKQDERKNENKVMLYFFGFMASLILLLGIFGLFEHDTTISMSIDESSLEGENYKFVKKKLEDMGFENIELEKVKDLKFGIFASKDDVKEVTINGNNDFEKEDRFDKNSKVTIYYHDFNK